MESDTWPVLLPVMPPVAPMLAKLVADIPSDQFYEPKWDGFRSIVFRDGDEVEIGSRNEQPMTRYFPEVVEAVQAQPARRAAWSTARSSSPTRPSTASTSRRCSSASTRRRAGSTCSPSRRRPASSPSTCWRSDDDDYMRRGRSTSGAPPSSGRSPTRGGADPPDPDDPATRTLARRWFDRVRGRRPGRADRQARRPDLPAGQAGHGQDQARADRGLRGGRLPRPQVRPGRRRLAAARALRRRRNSVVPLAFRSETSGRC